MTKYLFKKTGLFQFTNFLEWSIEKWPISRTGCQFGVPGVTYPPKKYPSAPPPPVTVAILIIKLIRYTAPLTPKF